MLTKILRKLLPALALSCVAYGAQATAVTYELTVAGDFNGSGSFTGTDGDVDGFLRFNELSDFSFTLPAVSYQVGLADLTDFGSYDITNNIWNADASSGAGPNSAYFAFWGGNYAATPSNLTSLVTTNVTPQQGGDVPEPATAALFGLGLAAAGFARRRKQAA